MGRPKKYTREQVLEDALEVFWSLGYSTTSLSDLTEATGLNKKSLYNEFGSKEGLFNEVLALYLSKKDRQIEILTREPLGVRNVIDYVEQLVADSSIKGCLMCLSISEKDTLEKTAATQVRADFRGLTQLIEANLLAEHAEQARELALMVSSLMFSVAGLRKLRTRKADLKSSLDILTDHVLKPLLPGT